MSQLTENGRRALTDMSQRYGLSLDAVEAMAHAVARGGGTMAQFNIPELGGSGQWMAGGMTMVGDMFDHSLKARVDTLCGELAGELAQNALFTKPQTLAGAAWWPEELGEPASVGGQNTTRYAYFPEAARVVFDPGNGLPLVLLDTGDHRIGGWSQQQAGGGDRFMGVSFSSQHGQFLLSSLPRVGAPIDAPEPHATTAPPSDATPTTQPEAPMAPPPQPAFEPAPQAAPPEAPAASSAPTAAPAVQSSADEILRTIERLAALRDAGALTEEEFSAKKGELLQRL
ncbi:MAG: SHOCT domain-containing protein [Rhodobacteraceae bacterium]|nr:SHOCT domain-containing protein [Paracoccaceae bacterium]